MKFARIVPDGGNAGVLHARKTSAYHAGKDTIMSERIFIAAVTVLADRNAAVGL